MIHPAIFYELLASIYLIGAIVSIAACHPWFAGLLFALSAWHYIKAITTGRKPHKGPTINCGPIYIDKEIFAHDTGTKDDQGENQTGA